MTISAGTNVGRYEIRPQIGVGGMGEVYLAEDAQLRRQVALKILPGELATDQDRMRRFIQEAQAAAALTGITYAVTADGQRFLVVTQGEASASLQYTVVIIWTAEAKK